MTIRSRKQKPTKRPSASSSSSSSTSSSSEMGSTHLSRFTYRKPPSIVFILVAFCFITLLGISSNTWSQFVFGSSNTSIYGIEVVNEFPHDPKAFTQGLLYDGNGILYESTGLNGHSSVRKVALETGKVKDITRMDDKEFGEGLTLLRGRLYQVTWLTKTGFIYDRNNLSKVEKFTHQMQDGWGLATDGKVLFGTDGTSTLYQIDPQTMKVTRQHIVKYNGNEVRYLNELEYIDGEVWANVWQTNCIARISPKDGRILRWILLPQLREGLIGAGYNGIDVLNGIAWDEDKKRLFVTGKLWPKLYEIKVHPVKRQVSESIVKHLCII